MEGTVVSSTEQVEHFLVCSYSSLWLLGVGSKAPRIVILGLSHLHLHHAALCALLTALCNAAQGTVITESGQATLMGTQSTARV